MNYFVFILSGKDSQPLHVGMTDDLIKGIYELSNVGSKADQHSKKLLHYEIYNDAEKANSRKEHLEKCILNRKN